MYMTFCFSYKWIIPVTFVTNINKDVDPDDLQINWLRGESGELRSSGRRFAKIISCFNVYVSLSQFLTFTYFETL